MTNADSRFREAQEALRDALPFLMVPSDVEPQHVERLGEVRARVAALVSSAPKPQDLRVATAPGESSSDSVAADETEARADVCDWCLKTKPLQVFVSGDDTFAWCDDCIAEGSQKGQADV